MYGGRRLASFSETWAMTAILDFGMSWPRSGTQHRWQWGFKLAAAESTCWLAERLRFDYPREIVDDDFEKQTF